MATIYDPLPGGDARTLRDLRRTHPDYDKVRLQRYADLFAGGECLTKRATEYITKNDVEPADLYKNRLREVWYINYAGPLIAHFAGYLFAGSPPKADEKDEKSLPDVYQTLKEDCDGLGTDLDPWMAARTVDALVHQRAYWRVETVAQQPNDDDEVPTTRRLWEQAGKGAIRLVPIPTASITNWRRNEDGSVAWLVESEKTVELRDFLDKYRTSVETWTLWMSDGTARRWQFVHLVDERGQAVDANGHHAAVSDDTKVQEVEPPLLPDHLGQCPVVELALPSHLWMMSHIADAQLEHFRLLNAMSWAIRRSAFVMWWFFLENRRSLPAMGTGYYGILGAKERIEAPAPAGIPFEIMEAKLESIKDEIHRVAQQMQRGVDNNAGTVGRSAESKQEDRHATEVALSAVGKCVKLAMERTYDLAASLRDEPYTFHVSGLADYVGAEPASVIDTVMGAQALRIPSVTLWKEAYKKAAMAVVPDMPEEVRKAVEGEIEKGVTAEWVEQMAAMPLPAEKRPPPEMPNPDKDEDEGGEEAESVDEPAEPPAKRPAA